MRTVAHRRVLSDNQPRREAFDHGRNQERWKDMSTLVDNPSRRWMLQRAAAASGGLLVSLSPPGGQALQPRMGQPLHSVSREAFGLHLVGVAGWDQGSGPGRNTPLNTFGCRSVRVWDTGATWRRIEGRGKGDFDWSRLDAEMAVWSKGFDDILFCLGQAPDWASAPRRGGNDSWNPNAPNNPQDAADFVTALLQRYPRITGLEHWNEPDKRGQFYSGTVEQLAQISMAQARAARAIRPDIVMVGAAPQSFGDRGDYLRRYLRALRAAGGADAIDVVSAHTYVMPRQPEQIGVLAEILRGVVDDAGFDLPLWSTEFGWGGIKNAPQAGGFADAATGAKVAAAGAVMAQDQAASYIARAYLVSFASGLTRQYFYAVDKPFSALRLIDFSDKARVLPAGQALAYLARLLQGGQVSPLWSQDDLRGVEFASADGRRGQVFWCLDGRQAYIDLTRFKTVRSVTGGVAQPPSPHYLVTDSPVFALV